MKKFKKKQAQQLVEFLLVAPFIIAFLAFFTEYAYALSINISFTKSLKSVCTNIYRTIKPNLTKSEIKTKVKNDLITALSSGNIPTKAENNITVNYINNGTTGVFMAKYTYYPAFTLPAVFFKIMPEKFDFFTTASIPSALLSGNDYTGAVDSATLDKIWSASSFSDLDAFDGSKNGVLKDTAGRDKIIFLVPATVSATVLNTYVLTDWEGSFIADPNITDNSLVFSKDKINLYSCNISTSACSELTTNTFDYLRTNNYNYIFVVNDTETPTANITSLSTYWNTGSETDLSKNSAFGILKRTISMTDTNYLSTGNYDNIEVSAYFSDVSPSAGMKIYPFGSMIFIDNSTSIRDIITAGKTRPVFTSFES